MAWRTFFDSVRIRDVLCNSSGGGGGPPRGIPKARENAESNMAAWGRRFSVCISGELFVPSGCGHLQPYSCISPFSAVAIGALRNSPTRRS